MSGYLVDTSIFIAAEQRRPLSTPPGGEARISVATLTELGVGVRRAEGASLRQLRESTLASARRFIPLPCDEPVSEALADLLATARARRRRAGAMAPAPWTRSSPPLPWPMTSRCGPRMATSRCSPNSRPGFACTEPEPAR